MDDRSQPRTERRRLTHVDRRGRPRMVDVSGKPPTARRAVAEAMVICSQETLTLAIDGRPAAWRGEILGTAPACAKSASAVWEKLRHLHCVR